MKILSLLSNLSLKSAGNLTYRPTNRNASRADAEGIRDDRVPDPSLSVRDAWIPVLIRVVPLSFWEYCQLWPFGHFSDKNCCVIITFQ